MFCLTSHHCVNLIFAMETCCCCLHPHQYMLKLSERSFRWFYVSLVKESQSNVVFFYYPTGNCTTSSSDHIACSLRKRQSEKCSPLHRSPWGWCSGGGWHFSDTHTHARALHVLKRAPTLFHLWSASDPANGFPSLSFSTCITTLCLAKNKTPSTVWSRVSWLRSVGSGQP